MKIRQGMFLPKEKEAEIKTAIRFYNILSCLSPKIVPILSFAIEILSILQARLGNKKGFGTTNIFSMFTTKRRHSSELTLNSRKKKMF